MAATHAFIKQLSSAADCGIRSRKVPNKPAGHVADKSAFLRDVTSPSNLRSWTNSVGGTALCHLVAPMKSVLPNVGLKIVCFRRSAKRRKRENEAKMKLLVAEQRAKRAAEAEAARQAELERRMAPPKPKKPLATRQLSELGRVAVEHIVAVAGKQPVEAACRIFEETVSQTGWEGVLKELASLQRWDLTLEVFRWLEGHPTLRASDHLRSVVIMLVGRAGRLDLGFELLERGQQHEERTPGVPCFVALARACARSGHIEQVLALFEKMYEAGLEPRVDAYNEVFEELVVGRVPLLPTLRLFALMQQQNVAPKRITYTMLITACHVGGSIKDAYAIFEGLEAARWDPDVKAFNALLYICIVYRDFKEARRVFWRMRETRRIQFNAKSYQLVVRLCREAGWGWRDLVGPGCWDDALRLYREMRVGNQWPTLPLYEELLRLVGSYNNYTLAAEYYTDLREGAHMPAFDAVYDALVNVDYRGEAQNPVRLLEAFRGLKYVPDRAFFEGMLAAYERVAAWQEAWLLLTAMAPNQCRPSADMYQVMDSMLTAADCKLAEQVRGEMRRMQAEDAAAEESRGEGEDGQDGEAARSGPEADTREGGRPGSRAEGDPSEGGSGAGASVAGLETEGAHRTGGTGGTGVVDMPSRSAQGEKEDEEGGLLPAGTEGHKDNPLEKGTQRTERSTTRQATSEGGMGELEEPERKALMADSLSTLGLNDMSRRDLIAAGS